MKERKYVPSIRVPSDDLVLYDEKEGVEHRPHEGEWVIFRRSVPMSVMRLVTRAAEISELVKDEEEISQNEHVQQQYAALAAEIIKALARQIIDWSWTDEYHRKLPRPQEDREAFIETLWDLEDYEIGWLQEHLSDGANLSKN